MDKKITPVNNCNLINISEYSNKFKKLKVDETFRAIQIDKNETNQPITLHWENINVHTPDTSKSCFNKFKKNSVNNSKHIIRNGMFFFISNMYINK